MADLVVAVPGDLATPTGGYAYARRVLALLPGEGIVPRVLTLPASFPAPTAAHLDETARLFAALPPGVPILVDGLAYGALPPATIAAAGDRPVLALVHHPLGLEEGLGEATSQALVASERAALALATRVVVTSAYTGRLLAERFGVPWNRIHVAPPGTDVASAGERAPDRADHLECLAIGAVTPRKGYDILVRALAPLADLPWRMTIVGALDRAPAYVDALRELVREMGLEERILLTGPVSNEALDELYRRACLVVSSSLFEGYGMVLAESMARGLPIVMARGGAADETVPDEAALKVPSGDAPALAEALRTVIGDDDLRARLAGASREAGRTLPRWWDAARTIAKAVGAAREDRAT